MLLKLFDVMILPICICNCALPGKTFFKKKFVPSNFLVERQLRHAVEKLNCVFIQQILGFHSKVQNWAVRSETNRYP